VFLEGNIVLSSNQVRGFSTKFSAFQNKWMDKMVQSREMKLGPQELVSALPKKAVCLVTKRGDLCC